jgi:hypothetical protein
MILRCQRIQERILKKSDAAVMGVESGGDDGFDLDEDSNSDDEDEEDEVEEEIGVVKGLADGFGSRTHSRVPTPTNSGGIGIAAPEELPIRQVLTLQSATQQSSEGAIINAPLFHTQQSAEGHFTTLPMETRVAKVMHSDVALCGCEQSY